MKKRTQLAAANLKKIMKENGIELIKQSYYPPTDSIILIFSYTDKNVDKLVEKVSPLANYRIEKGKEIKILLYQDSIM